MNPSPSPSHHSILHSPSQFQSPEFRAIHMDADHDDFPGDHLLTPSSSSFSQLLFGHDDVDQDHHHQHTLFSIGNGVSPRMLCFEGYRDDDQPHHPLLSETNAVTPHKSVITSSESSSASSSCNHKSDNVKKAKWVGAGSGGRGGTDSVVAVAAAGGGGGGRRQSKKARAENPTSTGHAKRKEKLGERIASLQQLVSPFGKTDTASVLHEAMGYIRFLHDQVQVLCSPYLQAPPSSPHSDHHNTDQGDGVKTKTREGGKGELSRRGLCLMPVESTIHVASSNGADFWSPAMGNNINSNGSSSARH